MFIKLPVLKIGHWVFSPGLISSLSTLMLLLLFVYLGLWQINRYHEKLNLQQELVNKISLPASLFVPALIESRQKDKGIKSLRYSRWQVTGQFINYRHILLDNQILEGRVGYRVITPFLSNGDPKLILVDRGWIPLLKDRTQLPNFSAILNTLTIEGIINIPTAGLQLKKIQPANNAWPIRVQVIDFEALSRNLGAELYPFILQLEPEAKGGFYIPPLQNFTIPAKRHLGYAIQWFTLALASLIYYIVINTQRLKDD